jgi:PEP-CTERM motif
MAAFLAKSAREYRGIGLFSELSDRKKNPKTRFALIDGPFPPGNLYRMGRFFPFSCSPLFSSISVIFEERFPMKHTFVKLLTVAIALVGSVAQGQLWNNEVNNGLGGVLITHPAGMTNGADRSAIGVGGTIFGFGAQTVGSPPTTANRVADDFTVTGADWTIDGFCFYAYQTGATVASITGASVQIYSGGPPGAGGTVIWGSETPITPTAVTLSNIYRTTNTDTAGLTRQLQLVDLDVVGPVLSAGTYWLDWSFTGTLASGPWQAPLTPLGATGLTAGNGRQRTGVPVGTWANALDGTTGQDFPFIIKGTQAVIPEPASMGLLVLGAAFAGFRRRR